MIGVVVSYLIVTPILHYNNHWYARFLPIHDSTIYDNTGHPYNISKVLTEESMFDLKKYKVSFLLVGLFLVRLCR